MTDHPTPLSAAGTPLPKRWLATIVIIWAGQAVSMVTSYAAGYAAVWYVTETTNSALALAAMSVCAYLPMGIIAPFGGAFADKHNRKLIMIAADLGVGLVSLALGIIILFGQVTLGLLVVLVVARSAGQALHSPAMMASMPLLVPERHLLRINTLDQLLMSMASIGAPAFGILLYTAIGFHSVMFLDLLRRARRRGGACPGENPHRTRQGRRRAARRRQPARRLARRGREPRAAHVALRHHARHDHLRALELHLPAHDLRPLQRRRLHGSACRGRVRHRHDSGIGHPHGLRRRKEARAPHRHSHAHRGGGRPRPAGFCHPPPSRPSWRCAVSWQWRAHGTTAP